MKKAIVGILLLAICFLPVVNVHYTTTTNRFVAVPYQVTERVPYMDYTEKAVCIDDGGYGYVRNHVSLTAEEHLSLFRSVRPERWETVQLPTISYRIVTVNRYTVAHYPHTVHHQKRVSALVWLLDRH